MDPSSAPLKSLRFVINRTLLVLIGIVFALAAAEVALRIFPIPNRFVLLERLEQQWQSDDDFVLHLKPNLDLHIYGHPDFSYRVRTNADGLRDEPFVGTFDIAAIGDSFTFGFGIEEQETWPARLEAIEDQMREKRFNFGSARLANSSLTAKVFGCIIEAQPGLHLTHVLS